jgi:flavorubredoxin
MAPMVHWPEVMMTYDKTAKVLYSADAFGTFGALGGAIFNDELDFDRDWLDDARRYYSNIVGKFGTQVQTALRKAAQLKIDYICPLHGPIWRSNLSYLIDKYQLWSTYEPEERGVLIAYGSMYGNTENAANVLAFKLADQGITNIRVHDVSVTDLSELISDTFKYSHLVLAAPSYNGGIYPMMNTYLDDMRALGVQNRHVAVIGNGSWGPVSAKLMESKLSEMKQMTLLTENFALKSTLASSQMGELDSIVEQIKNTL